MKIVVYANCQGRAFSKLLPEVRRGPTIEHFENWRIISGEIPTESFFKSLSSADIFVYQPISAKHDRLSTTADDGPLCMIPGNCKAVSFPYIYNDALWPCMWDDGKIINGEVIDEFIEGGATEDDIVEMFLSRTIDFRFRQRLARTMDLLEDRELHTDIKIAKFIRDRYRDTPLFLTHNHPTTILFGEVISQFVKTVWECEANIDRFVGAGDNVVNLPGRYPLSTYSIRGHDIRYQTEQDAGADKYYSDLLRVHFRTTVANREQSL